MSAPPRTLSSAWASPRRPALLPSNRPPPGLSATTFSQGRLGTPASARCGRQTCNAYSEDTQRHGAMLSLLEEISTYSAVSSQLRPAGGHTEAKSQQHKHIACTAMDHQLMSADWLYDELEAGKSSRNLRSHRRRRQAGIPFAPEPDASYGSHSSITSSFCGSRGHGLANSGSPGDTGGSPEPPPSAEHLQLRRSLELTSFADELGSREAEVIIPYLGTRRDSVVVEAGSGRGRLVVNLALKMDACAGVVGVDPDLQDSVLASKIASPLQEGKLLSSPLTFTCAKIEEYHFRHATHVILHNAPAGIGGIMSDPEACLSVVKRLACSPSFKLLLTMSPLPPQLDLVHLGEFFLGQSTPYSTKMYCHLYSMSFLKAPIGTVAQLYCKDGLCVLPHSHMLGVEASGSQPGIQKTRAGDRCSSLRTGQAEAIGSTASGHVNQAGDPSVEPAASLGELSSSLGDLYVHGQHLNYKQPAVSLPPLAAMYRMQSADFQSGIDI